MIIFVGGLIGAGKSTVAKGLAERLDYIYFDLDELKKEVYAKNPDYAESLREGIPVTRETRVEVFERAAHDLEQLIKAHESIVVDDAMHLREFRHMLFDVAENMARDYLIIWVRADQRIILKRLSETKREGHVLSNPIPLHVTMARDFEDFNRAVITCSNNGTTEETLDDLFALMGKTAAFADEQSAALPVAAHSSSPQS